MGSQGQPKDGLRQPIDIEKNPKKKFLPWHLLALYRHSPLDAQQRLSVLELVTGLTILNADLKPEEERVHDDNKSKRQLKRLNTDHPLKLKSAWKMACICGSSKATFTSDDER